MEKNKYVKPTCTVCHVEAQNMMALSKSDKPADGSTPLVNEDVFTDIWGNEW